MHRLVQATDRRADQRDPPQIMVRFSTADSLQHVGTGVVLDLSERGCKICSAMVLPMETLCALYLTIP